MGLLLVRRQKDRTRVCPKTNKLVPFSRKFKTHWKGPYIVQRFTDGGTVQLAKLNGEILPSIVNGSRLKKYMDKSGPLNQK